MIRRFETAVPARSNSATGSWIFSAIPSKVSTRSENGVANGMHVSSKDYDEDVSEFPDAGFTEAPCRIVEHPRIADERYRPLGRLYASRYCTTRQRFELPGPLPSE